MPSPPDRQRAAVEMRVTARQLFEHALAQASIDKAFQRNVDCERGVLRICDDLYDLDSFRSVSVISIGKAAHTLLNSLEMQAGRRFEGIVSSSVEPASQVRGFRYFRGGHPTPNAESIRAAEAMIKSLGGQNPESLVIFLLSGGGSSMAEKPIDDEISLDDLVATYRALVFSGANIVEMNAIRKHLSAIKGGRLARIAHPSQQVSLLVSDVPDNMSDALASGPTMPDPSTIDDCYAIVTRYELLDQFPESVRELFQQHTLEETPKPGDEVFHRSRWWPILSNASVVEASRCEAQRLGFQVEVDNSCDDWDYLRAANHLLERVHELRKKSERVCLISGGELTVKVANHGTGGRNQQFALACAMKIAREKITVLSAGTDGIDGSSPAAGAIVDGTTTERAKARGLAPETYLSEFNAYAFFDKLGDAIITGPTGNNLRDLRILLAY